VAVYYLLPLNTTAAWAAITILVVGLIALIGLVVLHVRVGFGDIAPHSQAARLVVTVQMIADLIILGLAIKVIVGAVRQARSAKSLRTTPDVGPIRTAEEISVIRLTHRAS
jgi:hypothetical protein